jgi:hypothetical protein
LLDVASSSSTKKAAKLAQKGKGRTVRFQGGTLFPFIVAVVLIAGLGLITYSRLSVPAAEQSRPNINDHWHAVYGFYLCDSWYQLNGNLEEVDTLGQFTNTNFRRTGIHSHDDGIMHWHAQTSRAVGRNAVLGVFLETYAVEFDNDSLKFPELAAVGPNPQYPSQGTSPLLQEYVEGETTCNGEDAELSVRVWDQFGDTGAGNRYIAEMDRIHLDQDGMVFAIYFAPDGTDQVKPPWAPDLPSLAQRDTPPVFTDDPTAPGASVPTGASVPVTVTGEPSAATVPGTTPDASSD